MQINVPFPPNVIILSFFLKMLKEIVKKDLPKKEGVNNPDRKGLGVLESSRAVYFL